MPNSFGLVRITERRECKAALAGSPEGFEGRMPCTHREYDLSPNGKRANMSGQNSIGWGSSRLPCTHKEYDLSPNEKREHMSGQSSTGWGSKVLKGG